MHSTRRAGVVLALLVLALNSACHSRSSSGDSSSETVQATPSVSGTVTAVSGASQILSIPFNASEFSSLSNLTVTSGLAPLPTGWSEPASFTCATVSSGNGCLLSLTYAPTGAASGTLALEYTYTDTSGASHTGSISIGCQLTLSYAPVAVGSGALQFTYSYTNNAGTVKNGTVNIAYTGTTHDNVVGAVSPVGTVGGLVGSSQNVTVNFTTDDGNSATGLAVASSVISTLPAG